MSLPVFIHDLAGWLAGTPTALQPGTYTLTGPEGKHAATVQRLQPGEQFVVTDAAGSFGVVTITAAGKHQLVGQLAQVQRAPMPQPAVTVFQALPKSERSELTVDLLTQAGADAIVPWQAQRCIAKWQGAKQDKGVQKWQQAAIAAAKQSRRLRIPQIAPVHSTAELTAQLADFDVCFVLHESATAPLTAAVQQAGAALSSVALIIGPEGGISDTELAQLADAGAQAVRLGPEVLRTATAGMVALAVLGAQTARWDVTTALPGA